jgi:hypothetical protein
MVEVVRQDLGTIASRFHGRLFVFAKRLDAIRCTAYSVSSLDYMVLAVPLVPRMAAVRNLICRR